MPNEVVTNVHINNKRLLLSKLNEIKLNLDWIERLDVTSDVKEITSQYKDTAADHDFNREVIL
jgi:hypothetical protein